MGKREPKLTRYDAVVINIMADGTVCEDLSTYLSSASQLPEVTRRLMVSFIEQGHKYRTEQVDC